MNYTNKGFTIIEILIITTIIGLLGTVGMSSFSTTNRNASDIRRKSDLESIKPKLSIYYQTKGSYPASLTWGGSLVEDGNTYIDYIPQDPKNSDGYMYYYSVTSDGSFVLCARLENNNDVNDIANTMCKSDGTKCNYCATMTGNYLAENTASNPMNATSLRNLTCTGDCTGKCAGDSDGCNGTCTNDPCPGKVCMPGGTCCTPTSCVGKCGGYVAGCGTTCGGNCASGLTCVNQQCVSPIKTGVILYYAGSIVPTGYLECNGQSTAGYPDLAAVVGGNVPDLRGQFVRVLDDGKGIDVNRGIGTTQSDSFKTHTHSYFAGNANAGLNQGYGGGMYNGGYISSSFTGNTTETRPKNVALMTIIKY